MWAKRVHEVAKDTEVPTPPGQQVRKDVEEIPQKYPEIAVDDVLDKMMTVRSKVWDTRAAGAQAKIRAGTGTRRHTQVARTRIREEITTVGFVMIIY